MSALSKQDSSYQQRSMMVSEGLIGEFQGFDSRRLRIGQWLLAAEPAGGTSHEAASRESQLRSPAML
jgi:hypothetical protein